MHQTRHVLRPTLAALAATALLTACSHTPPAPLNSAAAPLAAPYSSDNALILALAMAGNTAETRLHPEYIARALEARAANPKLDAAWQHAVANEDLEARRALITQLELAFIHDPEASALDLLGPELSEHFRNFPWEKDDYPGGPEGPNEQVADIMVDALDLILPERRANSQRHAVVTRDQATEPVWEYMTAQWQPVPGQENWKLNRHALASFVAMRDAAAADGVQLVIKSAHRDRKVAEAAAARVNNPAAVASFSSHSLGLAIDFQMSQDGLEFAEVRTSPMADVVRMRQSPVHKWLALRGHQFGWFPYQNEPWHWEYNPIGFASTFWADYPGGQPARTPPPATP